MYICVRVICTSFKLPAWLRCCATRHWATLPWNVYRIAPRSLDCGWRSGTGKWDSSVPWKKTLWYWALYDAVCAIPCTTELGMLVGRRSGSCQWDAWSAVWHCAVSYHSGIGQNSPRSWAEPALRVRELNGAMLALVGAWLLGMHCASVPWLHICMIANTYECMDIWM